MIRKAVSGLMLALLLMGILTLALNTQPVKSSVTWAVIIRADGNIDPPTAPIQRDGDIYTLTNNIHCNSYGIKVERDNIVLDGSGYAIEGAGDPYTYSSGISLSDRNNVTIKHITVKSFCDGIFLYHSNNNTITENNIVENVYTGIEFYFSTSLFNNTVVGNTIVDNDCGIEFYETTEPTVTGNRVFHNDFIGNIDQARVIVGVDAFDDGYPSGGNYWSDYTGVDEKSGPNQDQPGSDGIGDTPYYIDFDYQDRYPLMKTIPDDIYIVDAEPIQVVQEARALIKDKHTAIRVDIMSTFSQIKERKIEVVYDFESKEYTEVGRNFNGVTIRPGLTRVYLPGGPIFRKQGTHWIEVESSWPPFKDGCRQPDFFLRWTSQTGVDDKIKVKVEPLDNEVSKNNNEKMIETGIKVLETNLLRVIAVPVYFPSIGQAPFDPDLSNHLSDQRDFLQDIFPVGENSFEWEVSPAIPNLGIPLMVPGLIDLWLYTHVCLQIEIAALLLDYDRVVIVIDGFPYEVVEWSGKAIGILLPHGDQLPIIVRNDALPDEGLVAHEMGHTYYLWHPDRQEPKQPHGPDIIDAQIFRVSQRQYEKTVNNLMNAWLAPPVWIDKQRYDSDPEQWIQLNPFWGTRRWNLYEQFVPGSDPEILIISGNIFRNHTISTDIPWYRTDGIPTLSPGSNGNYSIISLNDNNETLSQYAFNATFSYLTWVNGTLEERELDAIPFIHSISYESGTTSIEIKNATGHILVKRNVSSNRPNVDITFPNGGEILTAGSHTISWAASDLDGDDLLFTLAYSSDGGASWIPLAINLNETSYTWDTSNMKTSDDYYVKVIATDGVNTGEDTSDDQFTVDPKPPIINILSPQNKTYYSDSVPLMFTIDETSSWAGYSLGNQPNATIYENTTINVTNGLHHIVIYANDTTGNMGASNVIYFTVDSSLYDPWKTSFVGLDGHPIVDFAVYYDELYAVSNDKVYIYDGDYWYFIEVPSCLLSVESYEDYILVGGQGFLYYFEDMLYPVFSVPNYIRLLGIYKNTIYAGTVLDNSPTLYYCNVSIFSPDEPDGWQIDNDFSSIVNFSSPLNSIDSFEVYNDEIYLACGNTVYLFNGSDWKVAKIFDNVGAFLDMKVYDDRLYLATRDHAWRKPCSQGYSGFSGRVIEFDGSNWTTILDHDYWIFSLEAYDGKLHAGTANKIFVYNGTDWAISFESKEGAYYAISLINYDGEIYAGMGNGYIFFDPSFETVVVPESPFSTILPLLLVTVIIFMATLAKKMRIHISEACIWSVKTKKRKRKKGRVFKSGLLYFTEPKKRRIRKVSITLTLILMSLLTSAICCSNVASQLNMLSEWNSKPPYQDYTPSGMPDLDMKQDGWMHPEVGWSWCGPAAVANSLWWLDSRFEKNAIPPPTISDNFPLLHAYGPWDDHDAQNVVPFVNDLAWLMDTDGQRTASYSHHGTWWWDLEEGINQFLMQQGVDCLFEVHSIEFPDFSFIEEELDECHDVILMLEFWNETAPGNWSRWIYDPGGEGGHYVTCAGVNSTQQELLISDPWQDAFERQWIPRGLCPLSHTTPHSANVHNDAQYVSQDAWPAALWAGQTSSPYPETPVWELLGYCQQFGFHGGMASSFRAFIRVATITSPLIHDVAVTHIEISKTVIGQGYPLNTSVTVENQGSVTGAFNVSVFYDDTAIILPDGKNHTTTTLTSGNSTTLTFTWNVPEDFPKGNYTISANATILPGETDTADNTHIDGWVIVAMPGDLTGPDGWPDGKCNMKDISMVARGFGANRVTDLGDPRYGEYWHDTPCAICPHSPNCDVVYDGKINMRDISAVARHFGETDP